MSKCFLITGGGTGAKIAEAYVHLCAAGCGPQEVHLLLVDADTDNGNVARTTDTIGVYNKVRPWGWKIHPKGGQEAEFFSSAITPYFLTERVSDLVGGSLYEGAGPDDTLHEVLDLFYDKEEQESDNQFGFLARPNLGSLILAEHLEHQLRNVAAGKAFVRALRAAMDAHEVTQIMVAGSIFGGTGASLLPVARACLLNVLELDPTDENRHLLRFAAVMMLPYFSPSSKVSTVDPARFLLDTSLALQYYGVSQFAIQNSYDRIYLIGSDNPGRASNQLKNPVSGGQRQTNPAFAEEWIAALAVRHFAEHGASAPDDAERVFVLNTAVPALTWENLPCQATPRSPDVTERMTTLLHLAAFFLRPARSVSGGLSGGLLFLLTQVPGRDLEYFSWFDTLLGQWGAERYDAYKNVSAQRDTDHWEALTNSVGNNSASRLQAEVGEYFARLLGWAHTALKSPGLELIDAPTATEATRDYARLHSGMCDVLPAEIDQGQNLTGHYRDDNPLARLVRAGAVALAREKVKGYSAEPGGDPVEFRRQSNKLPRAVVPCILPADLEAAAKAVGKPSAYTAYSVQA